MSELRQTTPSRSLVGLTAMLVVSAFFALLLFAWNTAPAAAITGGRLLGYLFARTAILTIAAFPALATAAVIVATARAPRWGTDPFPVVLIRHALLLTLVYTLLVIAVDPLARRVVDRRLYLGGIAQTAFLTALQERESGDPVVALGLAETVLKVNPSHAGGLELHRQLQSQIPSVARSLADSGPSGELPPLTKLGPTQLGDLAARFLALQDPYSGYHFADLSMQVEPNARALALRDQAARLIGSAGLTLAEIAAQSRFTRKQHAVGAEASGMYVESYYTWLELAAEDPSDPDVLDRLPRATSAVQQRTYWLPESEISALLPGAEELIFANRLHQNGTPSEVIRIGKLVQLGGTSFAHDLELIRFSPSGERTLHFLVTAAELAGRDLLLVGIQPQRRAPEALPRVVSGGQGPRVIQLSLSLDDLYGLRQPLVARTGIGDLRRGMELAARVGRASTEELLALVHAVSRPLFVLSLILTAALVGAWGRRVPPATATGNELLLLPLLVASTALMVQLLWAGQQRVADTLAMGLGLWAAAAITVGLQLGAVALVLALLVATHARGLARERDSSFDRTS